MKGIRRLTHMIGCTSVLLLVVACATPAPTATSVALAPTQVPSTAPPATPTLAALAPTLVPPTAGTAWATLAPTPTRAATPVTAAEAYADKIEDIVGIWLLTNNWYVEFMPEGTWRAARTLSDVAPGTIGGDFWFDGTVYKERGGGCQDVGQYEVRLVREGGETVALDWKRIKDTCTTRRWAHFAPSERVIEQ